MTQIATKTNTSKNDAAIELFAVTSRIELVLPSIRRQTVNTNLSPINRRVLKNVLQDLEQVMLRLDWVIGSTEDEL
jgi:hypothetical protein